jgi:hypothetical protein
MIETHEPKTPKRPARRRRRGGLGLYQTRTGRWKLDCWIRGQRLRQSFASKVRCNREVALLRTLYARMAAWGLCGIGSWGGQRPSLDGYVMGTGAHGWGARRRRVFMLPILYSTIPKVRVLPARGVRPPAPPPQPPNEPQPRSRARALSGHVLWRG